MSCSAKMRKLSVRIDAGISADRHIPIRPISTGDAVHRTKQDTNRSGKLLQHHEVPRSLCPKHKRAVLLYELIR